MILRFADCELDLDRIVLRRDGEEVKLEPKAFDLLAYLVQRRGTVVRKEELLDEVWGDRFVSESALTTRIKAVRQAVADDGSRQAIIRTVHGKGYEFVAPVAVVATATAGTRAEPVAAAAGAPSVGAALQPLIGRDALLDVLADALVSDRLITLVGPGGVGKTALGYELARRAADRYADGVHVVELVGVVDEAATAAAFATALEVNVRRDSSIDDAIVELLRSRDALLVLDNCEHLVESVAEIVTRILRAAPRIAIVATSREPLAVAGEQVWSVEPLSTAAPDPGADVSAAEALAIPAVALFVTRARAANPGFALDDDTARVVVDVCRRLDGIPLAIELAAARAHSIGIAELARRLDERFGLLKAMRRGSDPRHRTMRDAIGWSYDLLDPEERELFTALSVFAGSFDLRAAEAISPVGDALDVLTRLTERSMVVVRPGRGGATRYELLETLRDYGRTRLDDERAGELFTAHARQFAHEAETVAAALRQPTEPEAMARAEASFADLRAAQRFALDVGALDEAFTMIGSIREFAMRAMRYEVFTWAADACRAPGALEHPLAPLLVGIDAYGAWVRGEYARAISLAEESRRLEGALGVVPTGLPERVLGNVLYIVDRTDLGNPEVIRLSELAEESGDESRIVHACYFRAVGFSSQGRYDDAHDLVARARRHAEKTLSPTDLASAAVAEGFCSRDATQALEAFATSDRFARLAGNRWMSAFASTELAGLQVARGELERGSAGLADAVERWYKAGEWSQQWHTFSRCMIALDRIGQRELAMELVGAIEEHATLGVPPMSANLHDVAFETRDALVSDLGDGRAAELRAAGAACPVDDLVLRTRRALTASG